jgi:signal transduction histidine kinase
VTIGNIPGGFYVEDDGVGVQAESPDRIFESGFSTAEYGTGLGLSIVEQVAQAHGWEIIVAESDAGGARFEITGVE